MTNNNIDYSQPTGYISDYSERGLDRNSPQECVRETRYYVREMRKIINWFPKNPEAYGAVHSSLYEQLESLVEKVREHVETAESTKKVFEREINRCRENLTRIEKDRMRISTPVTQTYYQAAAGDQMEQYARVVAQHKAFCEGLAILRSLLKESDEIQRQAEKTRSGPGDASTGSQKAKNDSGRPAHSTAKKRWTTMKEWLRDNEDRIDQTHGNTTNKG